MNFFRLNDNDLPELHLVEQRTDIMDKWVLIKRDVEDRQKFDN